MYPIHLLKSRFFKIVMITIGSIIYAFGVGLILDPNNLAPGGITGLAIVINRLSGISTGTLIFLLNIPLILLGIWKLGWKVMVSTFYSIAVITVSTNILSGFAPVTTEIVPAIFSGAIICGGSIGIIFRFGGTTGGTDILVKILRNRFKHIPTGQIFFMTDLLIIILAGSVFKDFNLAIYALIAIVIMNQVLDFVLYGRDEAKMIIIISDHGEKIAEYIMRDINVGVTFLNGQGGYLKQNKTVILCVMRKQLAPKAEEIIKEVDGNAFMIVSSASEIFGEGYKNIYESKL